MNESDCERIDIALSGGGTRAALYSGGAMIAVQEAVLAGKVEVGAIHSVSGSSLLLARIILASDDRLADGDLEADLQLIRDEVEAIARYGFAPSPVAGVILTLLPGFVIWMLWRIALSVDIDLARNLGWIGVAVALVIGAATVQLVRRKGRFNLRRGERWWKDRPSKKQHSWFAKDHPGNHSALPTREVRFVCTSLNERRVVLVDPWREYPGETIIGRSSSLADRAGASAAVPFHSSAVQVGHHLLVDGGVLDNLGANALITQADHPPDRPASPRTRLIIVDASVRDQPPVGVRSVSSVASGILATGTPLVLVTAVMVSAYSAGFLGRSRWVSSVLQLLAFAGIVHLAAWFSWREVTRFRHEAGVLDAIMWSHRTASLLRLEALGDTAKLIELSRAGRFSKRDARRRHDLRTRLSAARGDTAVELVRASYEQVCDALGTAENPETLSWLDGLVRELWTSQWSRKRRLAWRSVKAAVRPVLLGRGQARLPSYPNARR